MAECKIETCKDQAVKDGYCKICFAIKDAIHNITQG
jgi:hypothetical protein